MLWHRLQREEWARGPDQEMHSSRTLNVRLHLSRVDLAGIGGLQAVVTTAGKSDTGPQFVIVLKEDIVDMKEAPSRTSSSSSGSRRQIRGRFHSFDPRGRRVSLRWWKVHLFCFTFQPCLFNFMLLFYFVAARVIFMHVAQVWLTHVAP